MTDRSELEASSPSGEPAPTGCHIAGCDGGLNCPYHRLEQSGPSVEESQRERFEKVAERIAGNFWISSQINSEAWRKEKIMDVLREELETK